MKKIYALFMTLCLIISATAGPLAGTAKKSYPLYPQEVVKAELSLDASMQKAPAATQALQYDATTGALLRYYNETDQMEVNTDYIADGQVYIDVMAADNSDYLSLLLFVEGLEDGKIPAGTYPITSEPAYGTAYASQGYSATQGVIPCAYYPLVTEGGKLYISTPMYFMVSGSVTIEYVGEDLKVTVEAVNSNNLPINIVYEVGGKSEKVAVKTPLKYDATEGELDVTYGADAAATVTDKGTYGTLQVMAPDASNMLALLFFYPEGVADTETTIPAGTYTISSKQAAGNVLASTGVSSSGSVSYSFYANLSGGQLVTPLYFLLDGTVEVSKVDGYLKVEVNATNSNDVPIHIVYDATPAEEIEWEEIDLEITNLTTEVMEVEGKKYLQLSGRNDMMDADVALFLNDYADVDGDYVVNAESSYMTYGGLELTVIEGTMTQTTDAEKGAVYTGTLRASVTDEEEGGTMYVEFTLTMYAAPATELVLTDAIVAIDEELGTLTFNVPTGEGEGYYAELAGYTAPGVHEGPQICLFMTPDAVAYTNYAETSVADGVITLKGEFTSFMGAKFDVTISGKLPVVELPATANVRAWAYDLALAVEGEQYTFSYKATTIAKATLIFTDAEGVELATKDLGVVNAGANTAVLAASELPAGKKVNWAVKLEAGAVAEPVEVTDQTRGIYDFYNMMDVLVDNNPESEYFGRIYIQMAYDGADDAATDRSAVQKAGFYLYDQALNELNPESNVSIRPTLPEGYTMGDNRNKFHRLDIDPKTGNLTWCYNMDAQPAVFAVDAANLAGEATNLVAGVAGLTRTAAHCYDAEGTLYVMDIAASKGAIYKIVDGQAVQMTEPTGKWVNASMTLAADGKGGLWVSHNRGQMDTYYQLVHVTAAGELDYTVWQDNTNGFEGGCNRGALAYDAERQLLAQGRNGKVEVYSVAYDTETGAPALTLVATTPTVGTNIDGLHFDYAGDLYVVNSSKEKFQKFAMPTDNNVCTTPAASKYAFELAAAEPVEVVGVVKRAVQNGEEVIVLTHEADGTAHIYRVVNGVAVAEVSQEGVIPVDAENPGSYLAISDIAVTEDGKLVANNYNRCSFQDGVVESGYKRGTLTFYIWNDLAAAPAIWFQSKASSNSNNSDQGYTMALTGTSTNANILVSGVHNTQRGVRMSHFSVVDGVYEDTQDGSANLPYYYYIGSNFKGASAGTAAAVFNEQTQGSNLQFHASPLEDENWIIDGELTNPIEFINPQTHGGEVVKNDSLTEDLGKKYNGASYVIVGEKILMVAPYATPEGKLTGVMILDITGGLEAAQYVDQLFIEEAVEATAAATAVKVVEGEEANTLLITLVADATIYSLEATLANGDNWEVYKDEITNMAFDLDNLIITGGPSTAFQVQVVLALGDSNPLTGEWQVKAESSVSIMGTDATFVEGTVFEVDAFAPSAQAIVRCEWNSQNIELHLTMSAAPIEPTVVVVENATIEIEKYQIFGDDYDYSLKMTGVWHNEEDGLDYPVLVEVPVYYPESTEPNEITSTVTVGGWGDDDPWLGFGEGTLTVTTVDNVVTATGIVQNPSAGIAIDITISGKLPVEEPVKYTVTATVNPAEAGTVEGAGEYEENAEATLIATAAEGYEFVNWTVAGEEVSTDATYTFTVTADVEVVANFKEIATGFDNINTTAAPVKMIKNGQLIIVKDGVEYTAQGATVK